MCAYLKKLIASQVAFIILEFLFGPLGVAAKDLKIRMCLSFRLPGSLLGIYRFGVSVIYGMNDPFRGVHDRDFFRKTSLWVKNDKRWDFSVILKHFGINFS